MAVNHLEPKITPPLGEDYVQVTLVCLLAVATTVIALLAYFANPTPPVPQTANLGPALRVDLNAAPRQELALLPGIGPKRADQIVQDRKQHGDYLSIQDLQRVHGIGPKIIRQVESICVVDSR